MARLTLQAEPVALSAESVDKLLRLGNGDAALLYLYLLRTGGTYTSKAVQSALHWNAAQAMSAFAHLTELGLAVDDTPPERRDAPSADTCPNYTSEDIANELQGEHSEFKALLDEVEHLLGKKLSLTETRILLELYDHAAMPAEVLLLVTARQIELTEQKYGPGRRPRMSEIKASTYALKKKGIDTLDAAEEWIRKQDYLQSREGELMSALDIANRSLIDGEKRFLHQWTEWGFGPEAVRMAYEKTVMQKGKLDWAYCNGILRSWNNKNAHTVQEINAAEHGHKKPAAQKSGKKPTQSGMQKPSVQSDDAIRRNAERLRKLLEENE